MSGDAICAKLQKRSEAVDAKKIIFKHAKGADTQ